MTHIHKSIHAAKNAFNDSIDLILGYASLKIKEFTFIYSGKELILFVPNLNKVLEGIHYLSCEISNSRGDIENRIKVYEAILNSTEFNCVVEFCESIPILTNNIHTEYGRQVRQSRRYVITTSLSALGLLIGIVGAIEKAPAFLRWLAKFYPALNNYF